VSDEEINEAIRLLAQNAKQVAEGAGAASLAAAIKMRDQIKGKKVVGILSGGNISLDRVRGDDGAVRLPLFELLNAAWLCHPMCERSLTFRIVI